MFNNKLEKRIEELEFRLRSTHRGYDSRKYWREYSISFGENHYYKSCRVTEFEYELSALKLMVNELIDYVYSK